MAARKGMLVVGVKVYEEVGRKAGLWANEMDKRMGVLSVALKDYYHLAFQWVS
jgi:hypothetical protein